MLSRSSRYSLIVLATFVPLAYVVAAQGGVLSIINTWKAFHELCIASGYAFLNYLFIHDRFASLFIILISSIGLIWSAIYVVRQIHYTKRLKAQLQAKTAIALSGNNDSATLVKDDRPFALTVGFLKPHIYLSSKLKKILSESELTCVTAHEQHHRRNYDPLFSLILETVSRLLFFLPAIRYVAKHTHLRHELAADQSALQNSSTDILASAILKSIEQQGASIAQPGVALGFSTISERVTYLINPTLKPVLRFSWLSIVWSVMMALFVLLATASLNPHDVHAQIPSTTGPMSQVDADHCRAEDTSYFSFNFPVRSEMNMSIMLKY